MMSMRMKTHRIRVVALALAGLVSLPARAGVIPGRWEKVSALAVASPVTVEMKDGDRVKGHYEGLTATDVLLVTHDARAAIPREDIETITTQAEDSLANGILIGAGVGAGIMGALAAGISNDLTPLGVLIVASIGLAPGLAVGAAVDAVQKPATIVLYEAP